SLRRQLGAMQAKLAEAKRRLGTLVARQRAAQVRSRLQSAAAAELDARAFEKFERLRRKVEQAEAETEALRELEAATIPETEPEPASRLSWRRSRRNSRRDDDQEPAMFFLLPLRVQTRDGGAAVPTANAV